MAEILFQRVSKFYGAVEAVKQIDLHVQDQELMVLVGPSGCGKSTLLRMIAGLEAIDAGELYIGGQLVNQLPPKDRDIAIVFQNYALYPHMTAYENLSFGLRIKGVNKQTIREKVLQTAKILEIEPLLDRKPKSMSGGQRQRIAIGRAIIRNPRVFLFDEPLSNLDAKLRGQMRLEIAKLHQRLQTTMVYVTHDQVEAMTLGDRIAVMHQGEIQQIATPQKLYNQPKNLFVAGFIGHPPMNFLSGNVVQEGLDASFVLGPMLKISLKDRPMVRHHPAKTVTLGIRPEHIGLQPKPGSTAYAKIRGKIQFLERFGHETFAFFTANDQQLVARLPPDTDLTAQQEIDFYLNSAKIYYFDAESGRVIQESK